MNKKDVVKFLDEQKWQPIATTQGECNRDNLKLVYVNNGATTVDGKIYFYDWGYNWNKPVRGLYYAYLNEMEVKLLEPKKHYKDLNAKFETFMGLLDSDNMFRYFSVRDKVITDEGWRTEQDELYVYPFSTNNGTEIDYSQSGRGGLEIVTCNIHDNEMFLNREILPNTWGIKNPRVILTAEFRDWILRGEGSDIWYELDGWLNSTNYDIDDDDQYEYCLNHLEFRDLKGYRKIINSYFHNYNELTGKKKFKTKL